MLSFQSIDVRTFLSDYWQKKPLVIRQALPDFVNPVTPDELAGLALEADIESRMVLETPLIKPYWHLKKGPFLETDFFDLPKTHWTLLVQGVDRFVPEVMALLENFNFIPQWRVDDVMISYAVPHGSVGPHYDQYDVFLYQGKGRRKWSLTTKQCHANNTIAHADLRIMAAFDVEEEYILEEGDMLYLPPQVGHHGVSLDEACMTYSFGYRRYQGQELWDSLGDFMSEKGLFSALYTDPDWGNLDATSHITAPAWLQARRLLQQVLDDESLMSDWFGCFATCLDRQAEQLLPEPLDAAACGDLSQFLDVVQQNGLQRDPACRVAYEDDGARFFINGCAWDSPGVSRELVRYVANHRRLDGMQLKPFLLREADQRFLYDLWKEQWLQF